MKIRYKHFNERDVEIPFLLDQVKQLHPNSILDVGAHDSHFYYVKEIRNTLPSVLYHAIDVIPNEETKKYVDEYFVGNVLETIPGMQETYDLVSCVSALEHSGLSTYKKFDYEGEQLAVFERILSLAAQRAVFTFPFGAEIENPVDFTNMTRDKLGMFCLLASKHGFTPRYQLFYNHFAQNLELWGEVGIDLAEHIEHDRNFGCQCVCLLSCIK